MEDGRQLPEWMTKSSNEVKEVSESSKKSHSSTIPAAEVTGNICDRRFVYLMSPRELQMVAKEILGLTNK